MEGYYNTQCYVLYHGLIALSELSLKLETQPQCIASQCPHQFLSRLLDRVSNLHVWRTRPESLQRIVDPRRWR